MKRWGERWWEIGGLNGYARFYLAGIAEGAEVVVVLVEVLA